MRPLPDFKTRSELGRLLYQVMMKWPHCRPGQALCNEFQVPKELEDKIYELKAPGKVIDIILRDQQ